MATTERVHSQGFEQMLDEEKWGHVSTSPDDVFYGSNGSLTFLFYDLDQSTTYVRSYEWQGNQHAEYFPRVKIKRRNTEDMQMDVLDLLERRGTMKNLLQNPTEVQPICSATSDTEVMHVGHLQDGIGGVYMHVAYGEDGTYTIRGFGLTRQVGRNDKA